jgi:hypothetical protein
MQRSSGQREGVPRSRPVVELQLRNRQDMRRPFVEDEGIIETDPDDRPRLAPEPASGGQLGPIEAVERRGDLAAADPRGDRVRYPY